ncbi:LAMI_0A04434g1_1 [Lachancea mirantina]|uniref:Protein DML1 n=1 Tax=Lachancea mirantina TaxID=1230905 RepID=A0A1G4IP15_9SACH|nr:LAMI_0A04434g1_1 [Lachancea mirantina]
MREILNIGVSHRACHLATQFYNCREELLQLSPVENDAQVFLNPTIDKISKTVSYAPRALLWDAKSGNGALGLHQYEAQGNDHFYTATTSDAPKPTNSNVQVIRTHPMIPKSQYQTALDTNSALPDLNDSNTRYWSDYAKLIYGPSNLNFLRDWYHDPENASLPDFQNLGQIKFSDFGVGQDEFIEHYSADFLEENFRWQLEKCEQLQGLNLISEIENSWGGFSSAMVSDLRDELPKATLFTWGFNQDDMITVSRPGPFSKAKFNLLCNKIRSTVYLVQESDLFFPLWSNTEISSWRQAGELCKLFDGVNSSFDLKDLNKSNSMNELKWSLQSEELSRNVVSGLEISDHDYSFFSRVPRLKNSKDHEFARCSISREKIPSEKDRNSNQFSAYEWKPSDTIPQEVAQETIYTSQLSITGQSRDVFRKWLEIVERHFRYDNDREELKDSLGTLASAYEEGFYDDEDSGDDDL